MNSKKIYNKLQQRMPNFQLGKVYKLTNKIDNKIYVGSTCKSLSQRLQGHKDKSKENPTQPVYAHINNIKWDNVDIVLIENYPCDTKKELLYRERYYIELLKSELNTIKPIESTDERLLRHRIRSSLQRQNNPEATRIRNHNNYHKHIEKRKEQGRKYYQANAEKIKEQHKIWCEKTREKINEQLKIRYENNKESIKAKCKIYRQNNAGKQSENIKKWRQANAEKIKEDRKIRYENNKESMKAASKKYRLDNREKIIQLERIKYQNNKVNCICGGSYDGSKPSMKDRHENTKKHDKYVNSNIHTLFWDKRNEILM